MARCYAKQPPAAAPAVTGEGGEIRIGTSALERALVPPGQNRSGVFRKLVTRVWA
jgi:hypothetical protein